MPTAGSAPLNPSLSDLQSARVLVVGDAMLDRYWFGAVERISPEAPVPVVQVLGDELRAGGAGNVALNVASLGARARVVGLVGDDEAGRLLEDRLGEQGVDCALERVQDAPTITKLRVISRHQQLIRLDFEERFAAIHAGRVLAALEAGLGDVDVLVLSDYAKGTLADVPALIAAAKARGIPVVVDPKGSDFTRYRGATIVKPNLSEFEAVVGPCPDEATLIAHCRKHLTAYKVPKLIEFRSELPKSNVGKILRRALRDETIASTPSA